MKKLLVTGGIVSMAFLLSSCFTLQSFVIGVAALQPGKSTKISMKVHPASTSPSKEYQFVLVGIDSPTDLSFQKAVWGANKEFGGPKAMDVAANMYTAIGTDCDGGGFTLSAITGMTWRGYTTMNKVPDKGKVADSALVTVGLKAKPGASSGDVTEIVGVTGIWGDTTGDGVTNDDTFLCTGNGSGALNIL